MLPLLKIYLHTFYHSGKRINERSSHSENDQCNINDNKQYDFNKIVSKSNLSFRKVSWCVFLGFSLLLSKVSKMEKDLCSILSIFPTVSEPARNLSL